MFGELCVEHQLHYLTLDQGCCCIEFYHICVIRRNMSLFSFRVPSDGPQVPGNLSWLLLPHILTDLVIPWALLDHCFPTVVLSPSICISVMPLHSDVFCFTANYRVWPALFQVTTVERRLCGSGTTWRFLHPLSRLLDPHTLHIFTCKVGIEG